MNNTQTPSTMSDLDYYNTALARFDAQPIGRAKLYLQSTLDGFQRANDPAKFPASAQRFDEAQALLRDFFRFGETSDIAEFAAWVEATIQCDTACNVPAYICDEIRREGVHARRKFYNV